jgi:hypothetical protein
VVFTPEKMACLPGAPQFLANNSSAVFVSHLSGGITRVMKATNLMETAVNSGGTNVVAANDATVYFTGNGAQGVYGVYMAPANGLSSTAAPIGTNGASDDARGLGLNATGVFWSGVNAPALLTAELDGGNRHTVISTGPGGLHVHPVSDRVLFVPALSPSGGLMNATIPGVDGGLMVVGNAEAFAAAHHADDVYWLEYGGAVRRWHLGAVTLVALASTTGYSMAANSTHVYWNNYGGGGGSVHLYRAPVTGGSEEDLGAIAADGDGDVFITADETAVYWGTGQAYLGCPSHGVLARWVF